MFRGVYILSFLLLACLKIGAQTRPDEKPMYRLYLIGDAGSPGGNPTLDLLKTRLSNEQENAGIIFLGDNIYNNGLPPKEDRHRAQAEAIIDSQINTVKGFNGDIFFIPGNHDWDNGGKDGWQKVMAQEKYIENALDSADVFFPSNGCPGPIEISITDQLTLVILDTQFFLQKWGKPGQSSSCDAKSGEEAFLELRDILRRNVNKKVIVASHHPIHTKGMHGGVVTAKDHIFPLTKLSPGLYIPLPIVGSLFPLYRQVFGALQDQANPQHKTMIRLINDLLVTHKNLVHVSGHEHALQYLADKNVNYVVSGAGSKQNTTVKLKPPSKFAGNYPGFGLLDYYANGEVWLRFESPDREGAVVYDNLISSSPFYEEFDPEEEEPPILPDQSDSVNVTSIPKRKSWLIGEGYRNEWSQKIIAPVFDIGKEKGGLKIIKRGGGNQTLSLRLEAADGKQYVLRSMQKDASKLIPEELRTDFFKKAVQEGIISSSHPYAAFAVPPLAEAVDVYHTNPKIVYIPDDPRFGIYRDDFKNRLCLFEERPAGDQRDVDFFGNAEKAINTPDMLEKLYKDNDNELDQHAVLRARLLDTYLGDWDRHDDQWRWAQKDKGKGNVFQPIPRDRDQVFFRNEGFLPSIIGASWAVPALQGFRSEIRDVVGLWSLNGKHFDRSFLTALEKKDWLDAATTMQSQLTDEVIEKAVLQWPDEIYKLHGAQITEELKARRSHLPEYALEYYAALAKEVDVIGSNKHELFTVLRKDNDTTHVEVFKINKDGEVRKKIYSRDFLTEETKEIRLYGLDGEDIFEIKGKVTKGPLVRAIGGDDKDIFFDSSRVSSLKKTWLVYDIKGKNSIVSGKETSNRTSINPRVNVYNRSAFKYNYLGPLASLKFNRDDGAFIGLGFNYKTQGFRKDPFKSNHKLLFNYAVATSSFSFDYDGQFTDVIGKADFLFKSEIRQPNYVTNYFGTGNETVYDKSRGLDYYRVRFEEFLSNASFRFNFGDNVRLTTGLTSQIIEVDPTPGRFITDFDNPLYDLDSTKVFDTKSWVGSLTTFEIDTRDKSILTEKGIRWMSSLGIYKGIAGGAGDYGNFKTDFKFFYSFRYPSRATISNRTGFAQVVGDYEFYQLNYLDGQDQMRGFNRYRFAGERMFYNNTDLDIKLFYAQTYVLPVQIGMKLFYDIGIVSVEGQQSDTWHNAYGAGLWVAPAKMLYVSLLYGRSREGWYPTFQFGVALPN